MALLKFKAGEKQDLLALTLVGKRILLSPVSRGYAWDLQVEFNEQVTRYMIPRPVDDIKQMYDYVDACREKMLAGEELTLVITSVESGEFLGVCALHGSAASIEPELGIWIKQAAQGRGLGREAVQTLLLWVRDNLDLDFLTYAVDKQNLPSRKLVEFLGGHVMQHKLQPSRSGRMLDQLVYQLKVA
ncbi:MAG: GNAT family N-acetyltransferase [Chromatiales bacterium]